MRMRTCSASCSAGARAGNSAIAQHQMQVANGNAIGSNSFNTLQTGKESSSGSFSIIRRLYSVRADQQLRMSLYDNRWARLLRINSRMLRQQHRLLATGANPPADVVMKDPETQASCEAGSRVSSTGRRVEGLHLPRALSMRVIRRDTSMNLDCRLGGIPR